MHRTAGRSARCRCASRTVRRNAARRERPDRAPPVPPSSMAPRANSGCAPAAASAANCSVTPTPAQQHRVHRSLREGALRRTRIGQAEHRFHARAKQMDAEQCRRDRSSPDRRRRRGRGRSVPARVGRPTTMPGLAPAMTGTQWPTSNCARGSPTIQASAAWPGTSSTVCPSGAPRASNWLAPVTPSALPISTRRIAVSGGSDCSSAGNRASAQRLSAPSAGPATSSLGASANGAAAVERHGRAIAPRPHRDGQGGQHCQKAAPAGSRQVGHPGPPPKGTFLRRSLARGKTGQGRRLIRHMKQAPRTARRAARGR